MTTNPQRQVDGRRRRVAPVTPAQDRAARASEHLTAELIAAVGRGERPPCGDGADLWLSDSKSDRARAARLCTGCVVLEQCGAAADARSERWHVWGGHDRETKHRPTKEQPPADACHNPASTTEGNHQMTINPDQEAEARETVARLFPQDPDGPHPQARPLRERPAPSGLFAERRTDAGIFTPRTTDTDTNQEDHR